MSSHSAAGSDPGKRRAPALLVAIGLAILAGPCYGQSRIDAQSLMRETQKIVRKQHDENSQDMTLVWWIPIQFWELSVQDNPAIAQQAIEKFRFTLDPYTLVVVLSAQIGPFGGMTFKSEEAVRASITLRDAQNVSYAPLADAQISADAKSLLLMLKPVLANLAGPLGQNLQYLLFNSKTKDGRPLADAKGEGWFTAVVAGEEFRYRLPLGSLLPPKYDPVTRDEFPGNYRYSPFTGNPLVSDPAGDAPRTPPAGSAGQPAQ